MLSDDVVGLTAVLDEATEVVRIFSSHGLSKVGCKYKGSGLSRYSRKGDSLSQEIPKIDVEHVARIRALHNT